jgi:hypothetical protein
MAATQRTLPGSGVSEDEIHRSKVDPAIFQTFLKTRKTLNNCTTAYSKDWEVKLFFQGTPQGGEIGAVKYCHIPCGALCGVSNDQDLELIFSAAEEEEVATTKENEPV